MPNRAIAPPTANSIFRAIPASFSELAPDFEEDVGEDVGDVEVGVVVLVLVLVPGDAKLCRLVSLPKVADTEVEFWHVGGEDGAEPATKFRAAHCTLSA